MTTPCPNCAPAPCLSRVNVAGEWWCGRDYAELVRSAERRLGVEGVRRLMTDGNGRMATGGKTSSKRRRDIG